MGKYGIGSRVRDEDGDEGVIVGKRKGERQVQYEGLVGGRAWLNGESIWWSKSSLTPIADNAAEWQPKVGDRVRFKTKNPSHCAVYSPNPLTVERLGDEGRVTILYDPFDGYEAGDLTQTVQASDLEPLPVAAEAQGAGGKWVPEVGQRVRRVKGQNSGTVVGTISVISEIEELEADPSGPWLKFTDGTEGYYTSYVLEPLTIVAGRNYRTRDGRKVLVHDNAPDTIYPFYHDCGTDSYHAVSVEGKSCIGDDDDLVAEWVDEKPVAVAPATATPLKKGDLVTLARSAMITGFDADNPAYAHVVLGTGGAYTLPRAALVAAS